MSGKVSKEGSGEPSQLEPAGWRSKLVGRAATVIRPRPHQFESRPLSNHLWPRNH